FGNLRRGQRAGSLDLEGNLLEPLGLIGLENVRNGLIALRSQLLHLLDAFLLTEVLEGTKRFPLFLRQLLDLLDLLCGEFQIFLNRLWSEQHRRGHATSHEATLTAALRSLLLGLHWGRQQAYGSDRENQLSESAHS